MTKILWRIDLFHTIQNLLYAVAALSENLLAYLSQHKGRHNPNIKEFTDLNIGLKVERKKEKIKKKEKNKNKNTKVQKGKVIHANSNRDKVE